MSDGSSPRIPGKRGKDPTCAKKCKECNTMGNGIGRCVRKCAKSGNPEGYDCFGKSHYSIHLINVRHTAFRKYFKDKSTVL